ncbi:MAG: hypothetical protein M4579_003728 [Chaenotheca gracillima]|nr:MAG: hypothetical protein M4579_003728 [Chaenotheca gracillima]
MTLDLGVLAAKDCVCHNVPGAPTTFDASATQETCQTYHDRAAKVGAVNAIEVRDGKCNSLGDSIPAGRFDAICKELMPGFISECTGP